MTAKIHDRNANTLQQEQNMKQKKLVLMIGVLALVIGAMVAGCRSATGSGVVRVTSVSLNITDTVVLDDGNNFQLVATVFPENATNKEVTWESTNPTRLTVDATGKVTYHYPGGSVYAEDIYIIVKTVDSGKTSVCKVSAPGHL